MPTNLKLSTQAVNAEADAVCALLNSGFLDIYDGLQPPTADTPIGAQTKLARLGFGSPAFAAAVAGVAAANAIASDPSAPAAGAAAWFRALTSTNLPIYDGSVGTSGCDMNLATTSISVGAVVSISSGQYTSPKA